MRKLLQVSLLSLALVLVVGGHSVAQEQAPLRPEALGAVESVKAGMVATYVTMVQYIEAVKMNQYAEAIRQNQARASSINSRNLTPQRSTGNSGPHSDAWWRGVAQCEQGGRNDPYFGYFSFMDGSQGGRSWEDQVAAGNNLLRRAGREVGPWAASCVASGYRASPGG